MSTPPTYAISDVHGHLADLRVVLAEAGLVAEDRWTGGDAQLWVLGDLVDRGPEGIGVIRLLRALQEQAPGQVHVLMGNHESLMLGQRLFPSTRFTELWLYNGGRAADQDALTDEEVVWLQHLPLVARVADWLLMHSDIVGYLQWGSSVEEVNTTVGALLVDGSEQSHFEIFAALTDRYDFMGDDGAERASRMLEVLGGRQIMHGHSIIGSLVGKRSAEVTEPLVYADGLVTAIDGGRYDGGPLLLVRLD
jgi:hypothetical protein